MIIYSKRNDTGLLSSEYVETRGSFPMDLFHVASLTCFFVIGNREDQNALADVKRKLTDVDRGGCRVSRL